VVVAGELVAGQSVAVELRLPNVGLPVRARAQVRYQDRLRCGLQFVGLPLEQREKIRYWASHIPLISEEARGERNAVPPLELPALAGGHDKNKRKRGVRVHRGRLFLLLAFMLALAAFGWWQWQSAWNELDADASLSDLQGAPLRVAPETMDKRIVYKVDPVYPEDARRAGIQGVVILDARIAPDGTVKRLHPVAGPDVLAQSALDAVQSWRFAPYRSGGEAVEVETTITLEFRLH
jgi:protein TonB